MWIRLTILSVLGFSSTVVGIECDDGEFACEEEGYCLPTTYLCDGFTDCFFSGDDEKPDVAGCCPIERNIFQASLKGKRCNKKCKVDSDCPKDRFCICDEECGKSCATTVKCAKRSKPDTLCEKQCLTNKDCDKGQTCTCQGSCGRSCIFDTVDCGLAPDIENANVEYSGTGEYKTAAYTCNDGKYKDSGDNVLRCSKDGTWIGTPVICKDITCGQPWGIFQTGGKITNLRTTTFYVGDTLEFACPKDTHRLLGSAIRTCQSDGKWSGKLTTCDKIIKTGEEECVHPGVPINGQLYGNSFKIGATVTFKCSQGYFMVGDEKQICTEIVRWSGGGAPLCLNNKYNHVSQEFLSTMANMVAETNSDTPQIGRTINLAAALNEIIFIIHVPNSDDTDGLELKLRFVNILLVNFKNLNMRIGLSVYAESAKTITEIMTTNKPNIDEIRTNVTNIGKSPDALRSDIGNGNNMTAAFENLIRSHLGRYLRKPEEGIDHHVFILVDEPYHAADVHSITRQRKHLEQKIAKLEFYSIVFASNKKSGNRIENLETLASKPSNFIYINGQLDIFRAIRNVTVINDYSRCGISRIPHSVKGIRSIGRAIGGYRSDLGTWPWQAIITRFHSNVEVMYNVPFFKGGGSVINKQWILTAAHIFKDHKENMVVTMGISRRPQKKLDDSAQVYRIGKIIIHEKYNGDVNFKFDFALVKIGVELLSNGFSIVNSKISNEIKFNEHVGPVCLPCQQDNNVQKVLRGSNKKGKVLIEEGDTEEAMCHAEKKFLIESGEKCSIVVGFGHVDPKRFDVWTPDVLADHMNHIFQKILPKEECDKGISKIHDVVEDSPDSSLFAFNEQMICTRNYNSTVIEDACFGDSGGPLLAEVYDDRSKEYFYVQLGIVSFGYGCGQTYLENGKNVMYPGYYARVGMQTEWIEETIKNDELQGDATCSPPQNISNAYPVLTRNRYAVGAKYVYNCKVGFKFSGGNFTQCENEGVWGPSPQCIDINECTELNQMHQCSPLADCTNTKGSYLCMCKDGYVGGGFSCEDINECRDRTHDCDINANCFNIEGSFICSCRSGFIGNGKNCSRFEPCTPESCSPDAQCVNVGLTHTCTCNMGFHGNGKICTAITCPKPQNISDGYFLRTSIKDLYKFGDSVIYNCQYGFKFHGTNSIKCEQNGEWSVYPTCHDIDECKPSYNMNICKMNSNCINTPGSFRCDCFDGFTGNGKIRCTDINECTSKQHNCSENATCLNSYGSYNCECKKGFTGDGKACTGKDPCLLHKCSVNAKCVSENGVGKCTCNKGYVGDGSICEAISCTDPIFIPNGFALNRKEKHYPGDVLGYTCNNGYESPGGNQVKCEDDGQWSGDTSCLDINECSLRTDNCDVNAQCFNTEGSFRCQCNSGYTGNGRRCSAIDKCASVECPENSRCIVKKNTAICDCYMGYTKIGNICSDVNECRSPSVNPCPRNAQCQNTEGSYKCVCKIGYTGNEKNTCTDINECLTVKCSQNAKCVNTDGSYECNCNAGYRGNGRFCYEINECNPDASVKHECSPNAICQNTKGSYKCTCKSGFVGNGKICKDIDECTSKDDPCPNNAKCSNTEGSYVCTCNQGFKRSGNLCTDINECALLFSNNCSSNAECANTVGSYSCTCNKGYTGNGIDCKEEVKKDIDECALRQHDCARNALCTNTGGSYICRCKQGFTGNGKYCRDVNECLSRKASNEHICSPDALCVNTIGSYECQCKNGYYGNGRDCKDVDECTSTKLFEKHDCSSKSTCINTKGSYQCSCKKGFTGNGRICEDINECTTKQHDCSPNALCKNNEGSYTCTCKDGYTGNGRQCKDVNECTLINAMKHKCSRDAICINTIGSYRCSCKKGFKGNGQICTDVDECFSKSSECSNHARCVNTRGSYQCLCNDGYSGNGKACTAEDECTASTSSRICSRNAECKPVKGRNKCVCKKGFSGNGKACTDINECTSLRQNEKHDCPVNSVCVNIQGSFHCDCNTGYFKDGKSCLDLNECTTENLRLKHNCGENAVCTNTMGSYQCTCKTGYFGNGRFCADLDECRLQTHECSVNAKCVNTKGSYACTCNLGFTGDGVLCIVDDECSPFRANAACSNNARCRNVNGRNKCVCNTGYSGNGKYCSDIDECSIQAANDCAPDADCFNTRGSYTCACKRGYQGSGKWCIDINECSTNGFSSNSCDRNARCTNTQGSYQCSCNTGYTGDGFTCTVSFSFTRPTFRPQTETSSGCEHCGFWDPCRNAVFGSSSGTCSCTPQCTAKFSSVKRVVNNGGANNCKYIDGFGREDTIPVGFRVEIVKRCRDGSRKSKVLTCLGPQRLSGEPPQC